MTEVDVANIKSVPYVPDRMRAEIRRGLEPVAEAACLNYFAIPETSDVEATLVAASEVDDRSNRAWSGVVLANHALVQASRMNDNPGEDKRWSEQAAKNLRHVSKRLDLVSGMDMSREFTSSSENNEGHRKCEYYVMRAGLVSTDGQPIGSTHGPFFAKRVLVGGLKLEEEAAATDQELGRVDGASELMQELLQRMAQHREKHPDIYKQ